MRSERLKKFRPEVFLSQAGIGRAILEVPRRKVFFSQGDVADAVFYLQKGRAKLCVVSREGKEATVALLGPGSFVGEDCVAGIQSVRMASAVAITDCTARTQRDDAGDPPGASLF